MAAQLSSSPRWELTAGAGEEELEMGKWHWGRRAGAALKGVLTPAAGADRAQGGVGRGLSNTAGSKLSDELASCSTKCQRRDGERGEMLTSGPIPT